MITTHTLHPKVAGILREQAIALDNAQRQVDQEKRLLHLMLSTAMPEWSDTATYHANAGLITIFTPDPEPEPPADEPTSPPTNG